MEPQVPNAQKETSSRANPKGANAIHWAVLGLVVVLVALLVRGQGWLSGPSMWEDELMFAFSVLPGQGIDGWIFGSYRFGQMQPPLAYGAVRMLESVLGPTELALRLPSVLFGVGTVALLFFGLGKRVGWLAGSIAASGLALTGFHQSLTIEARPYPLAILLFVWCWFAMEDAIRNPIWKNWMVLGGALALLSWSHNMISLTGAAACFIVGAVVVAWRVWWPSVRNRAWRPYLGGLIAPVVGVAFWMPAYFLGQGQGTPHSGMEVSLSPSDLVGKMLGAMADPQVWNMVTELMTHSSAYSDEMAKGLLIVAGLGLFFSLFAADCRGMVWRGVLLGFTAVLVTGVLSSLTNVAIYSRYVGHLAPLFFGLVGIVSQCLIVRIVGLFPRWKHKRSSIDFAIAALLLLGAIGLREWGETDPFAQQRPDFRGAAQAVEAVVQPGDLVLASPWISWYQQDQYDESLGAVAGAQLPLMMHLVGKEEDSEIDYIYFVGWSRLYDEEEMASAVDLDRKGNVHLVFRAAPQADTQGFVAGSHSQIDGVFTQLLTGTAVISVASKDGRLESALTIMLNRMVPEVYQGILDNQGLHEHLMQRGIQIQGMGRMSAGTRDGPSAGQQQGGMGGQQQGGMGGQQQGGMGGQQQGGMGGQQQGGMGGQQQGNFQ